MWVFLSTMKKIVQAIGVALFILLFACDERKHVAAQSATIPSEASNLDSLDSLSSAIIRYLKMHEVNNFVGHPAQAFKDSIPFSTTWPSFGWEDASICYIYYNYEGTDLNVVIYVMDSPYRFDLDTMRMLDQAPEKIFQYNIGSICVSRKNKCLVEASR